MISWTDVQLLTKGHLGRTVRTVCPFCSSIRKSSNQRKPVFAIKLKDLDFAVYNCVHCGEHGFVHPNTPTRSIDRAEFDRRRTAAQQQELDDERRRTERALALWQQRELFWGSPAETYLRVTRCIGDWLDGFALEDFGYLPACPFGTDRLPCMLALVRDARTNRPVAIHRTALLTTDNPPQKIGRMSLGPTGGGAIKINDKITKDLLIGEGIETVLSASKQFQFKPVWSLISKNNLSKFPIFPGLQSVTIAVDNDPDGRLAAMECAHRQLAGGVKVIRAKPHFGKDFNDLLMAKVAR